MRHIFEVETRSAVRAEGPAEHVAGVDGFVSIASDGVLPRFEFDLLGTVVSSSLGLLYL